MTHLKELWVAGLFIILGCEPSLTSTGEPTLDSSANALSAVFVLPDGDQGKARFYSGQPGINQEIINMDKNAPLSMPERRNWGWRRIEIPRQMLPLDSLSVELDVANEKGVSFWAHAPGGLDMGCMEEGTVKVESATPNMSGKIGLTRIPEGGYRIQYKLGVSYLCGEQRYSGSYMYDAVAVEAN